MRIFTILSCSSKGHCPTWGLSHTKQGSGSQTSSWSSTEPSKYLFASFQVFVYIFTSICLHLSEYLFTFFQVFVYIFLLCFKTYLDIECFTVWGFLEHLRKRHCVLHNEVVHTKSRFIKIFSQAPPGVELRGRPSHLPLWLAHVRLQHRERLPHRGQDAVPLVYYNYIMINI